MNERYRLNGLELDGFGDGDMGFFVVANGRAYLTRLAIPADWEARAADGYPYFIGIIDGRPAYRTLAAGAAAIGWGVAWGVAWGGPDT